LNPDSLGLRPFAFAVSGANIYAADGYAHGLGAPGGILLSTDNGTSWTQILGSSGYGTVRALAASGSKIVAGSGAAILLSTDNGTSWTTINSGLVAGVYGLAWSGTNIFASTASGCDGGRVYLLTDQGTSWDTFDTGLRTSYVFSLGINGGYLFAGTYGGEGLAGDTGSGVWRRPLSEMITSVNDFSANELPATFALEQNYPNPFNPNTTIRYALPTTSRIRLRIFNVLGQVVADLVSAEQPAGWNQVVWNAKISSGIYFYRIEAVSIGDPSKRFAETKKMIMLK
jgi:hypothetical protein